MESALKRQLSDYARSLGFERIGVTSVEPLEKEGAFLKEWLAAGRAGEMDYLDRNSERRSRPAEFLPGAKSVIALAVNYIPSTKDHYNAPVGTVPTEAKESRISRYAWGRDYHKVLSKRLDSFVRYMEALVPETQYRTFVDTGPLLERALAQRAGVGFIGKNTMLITKGLGSWVFLASVITTLDLPIDAADERSCGECRLCIDACPTEAITEPFTLDARRCIAYLTIESEKSVPETLRAKMGGWVFGCDICQEVCPHNVRPTLSPLTAFQSKAHMGATLAEILSLQTDEEFGIRFAGTAVIRAGRDCLVRNGCIAAANLGRTDLTGLLQGLAKSDSSPIVQEHAAWALERLNGAHSSDVRPPLSQN